MVREEQRQDGFTRFHAAACGKTFRKQQDMCLVTRLKEPTEPGEVSFELGPPVAPQQGWICGTDLVWPILRVNGIKVLSENGEHPYLCRHQFEAGD